MKKLFTFLCVLLLIPFAASGFGYLTLNGEGTLLPGVNARSVAFGGIRSLGLGDESAVLTNPAGLGRLKGTSVSISVGPGIGSALMLDSLGQHDANWLGLTTLYGGVSLPAGDMTLGAAVAEISNFSYDLTHYTYEFGIELSGLKEIRKVKSTGGMYELVGGMSYPVLSGLTLGLSAGYRFGSARCDSTYKDVEEPDNDTLVTREKSFGSFCWHGGLEIPLETVIFGLSWASGDDDYPARAAAGASMYAGKNRDGTFGMELELEDPGDGNSTNTRIFGSAFLDDSFELMGCLSFGTVKYDKVETGPKMGLALGAGIHLGSAEIDGGFSWTAMSRDSISVSPGQPDELQDSMAMMSFGFSWKF